MKQRVTGITPQNPIQTNSDQRTHAHTTLLNATHNGVADIIVHIYMVLRMALWIAVALVWRVGRVMRGAWGKEGAGVSGIINFC